MRYLFVVLLLLSLQVTAQKKNASGWMQLFNGKDLSGWSPKITGYPFKENFGNTFSVENGVMKVKYDAYDTFNERFGHIFYKNKYGYYLMQVEYRFTGDQVKGGPGWAYRNSGVMIHCQAPETMGLKQDFPISLEVQLLGGNGKDERPTGNLCTPGTNVVMNGKLQTNHCFNSTSKTYHGDQWVTVQVLVLGDSLIQHIVEGKVVMQYEQPQIGNGNVSNFDPAVKKDGMLLKEGYISLQSESHPVEFRKVELFDLAPYAKDPATLAKKLKELGIR